MTPEEKVKAKLDKWVVPGVPPDRHWHKKQLYEDFLLSTSDLDFELAGPPNAWLRVQLETDGVLMEGAGTPAPRLSPVPDNFEEVQNWVRMIDNLT